MAPVMVINQASTMRKSYQAIERDAFSPIYIYISNSNLNIKASSPSYTHVIIQLQIPNRSIIYTTAAFDVSLFFGRTFPLTLPPPPSSA